MSNYRGFYTKVNQVPPDDEVFNSQPSVRVDTPCNMLATQIESTKQVFLGHISSSGTSTSSPILLAT